MARYVSRSQNFKKAVLKPVITLVQGPLGPEQRETAPGLIAFFAQGGVTPYEAEIARQRFTFTGLSENENPIRRLSVYDTDEQAKAHGWDAEKKAQVEATLDAGTGENYFRVEQPAAPLPWPSYDDVRSADDVVTIAATIGVDLSVVLAYERENQNRKTYVAAIEKALGEAVEADPDEIVVEA